MSKYTQKFLEVSKEAAAETGKLGTKPTPPPGTKNKGGRPPGRPNKFPGLLKEALIEAAEIAGNRLAPKGKRGEAQSGLINYLAHQAIHSPNAFLPLLGRVLPLQVENNGTGPLLVVDRIEYHVIDGKDKYGQDVGDGEGAVTIDGTASVVATDEAG